MINVGKRPPAPSYGEMYDCRVCGRTDWSGLIFPDDRNDVCLDCLELVIDEDDGTRFAPCQDCCELVMSDYIDECGYWKHIPQPLYCEDCAAEQIKYQFEYIQNMRQSPRHGYVYLLDSQIGVWKIGRSSVPVKRISTLEVKLPYDLEVIALIETKDMYGLESHMHNKYAAKRVKGEWFRLSSEEVEYIRSLVAIPAWRRTIRDLMELEDLSWR
jgi:hypothetical protein